MAPRQRKVPRTAGRHAARNEESRGWDGAFRLVEPLQAPPRDTGVITNVNHLCVNLSRKVHLAGVVGNPGEAPSGNLPDESRATRIGECRDSAHTSQKSPSGK
jgi:hypothetical protein